MANKKSMGLGKGLGALIREPEWVDLGVEDKVEEGVSGGSGGPTMIALRDIVENPYQPRTVFLEDKIAEMAESIRIHGIIQPILVRKKGKKYELIAGERRFRGAIKAGLIEIPAIIKEMTDEAMMEIALIENLQREDLNPLEEAVAYEKLIDKLSYSTEEVADRVGKSRPHVANLLRLLRLPQSIQDKVAKRELTMGHARALLSLEDEKTMVKLAAEIIQKDMSVRQVEKKVKDLKEGKPTIHREGPSAEYERALKALTEKLESVFATKIEIKDEDHKGTIAIHYYSPDDLERIVELIEAGGSDF